MNEKDDTARLEEAFQNDMRSLGVAVSVLSAFSILLMLPWALSHALGRCLVDIVCKSMTRLWQLLTVRKQGD